MKKSSLNLLWLLPWIIVSWALFELLWLVLFIPGAILFPLAYRFAPTEQKPSMFGTGPILGFRWKWLDLWLGNYEDGLAPELWAKESNGTAYGWFLRNPVTNLRFIPFLSTTPDPSRVRWIGNDWVWETRDSVRHGFVCWQGPYGGFRIQGAKYGVWLGFKVRPRDASGVADYRTWGISMACQFLKS